MKKAKAALRKQIVNLIKNDQWDKITDAQWRWMMKRSSVYAAK